MSDTLNDGELIRVICVPTEAGTHNAGQCKAPEAILYAGGLEKKLKAAGFRVSTHDKVIFSDFLKNAAAWKPSPRKFGVRNEENAYAVMSAVQKDLLTNHNGHRNSFPIILGGDCSITPAVLAGLSTWHEEGTKIGLLYFDGDVDLTLPLELQAAADGSTAVLDSMTMTHLTARDGGLKSMRQFTAPDGSPLVNRENVVLFGFDPLQPTTEHWVYLLENGFKAFTRPTVQVDPLGCAKHALQWLEARVDVIYLHFDVDCIDSGAFPLGNYPHYAGLGEDAALGALGEFLCSEKVKGLTVTEVNPNNDPDGWMVERVVDSIVEGLKMRRVPTPEFKLGSSCTF